jgi:hypothetical protein
LNLLPSVAPRQAAAAQVSPWIKAVADYQQLYSRATLVSVTEDPALSARVINDLRVNDGVALVVPDLRNAALTFKRVQLLSFHDQPVVQMAYLPEHGEPIALCVTRDARPDERPHAEQIGEMSSVAWRRDNLAYVARQGSCPDAVRARPPYRERRYKPPLRSQQHSAGTRSCLSPSSQEFCTEATRHCQSAALFSRSTQLSSLLTDQNRALKAAFDDIKSGLTSSNGGVFAPWTRWT